MLTLTAAWCQAVEDSEGRVPAGGRMRAIGAQWDGNGRRVASPASRVLGPGRICGTMLSVMRADRFWEKLDDLVAACDLVIDRPRGTLHPRYGFAYPLDYGYLAGTRTGDGEGIDVWAGSLPEKTVTGLVCTVDAGKGDAEVKLLLGCTPQERYEALAAHNRGAQAGILVERPELVVPGDPNT